MVAGGKSHRHDGSISAATAETTGSAGEQGNPAGEFLSPDPVRRLDQFRLSEGNQSHNHIQSGRYVSAAGGEPDFSGWIAAGVPGVCRYVSLSSDARAGMAGVNDCQTDFGESVPGWIPFEWS